MPINEEIYYINGSSVIGTYKEINRKDYDRINKTIKKCRKAEELLEEALEEKRKSLKKQVIIYGPDARAIIDIQDSLLEIKSFISTLQRLKTRGYVVWKS